MAIFVLTIRDGQQQQYQVQSMHEVAVMMQDGRLLNTDYIWSPEENRWKTLQELLETPAHSAAEQQPQQQAQQQVDRQQYAQQQQVAQEQYAQQQQDVQQDPHAQATRVQQPLSEGQDEVLEERVATSQDVSTPAAAQVDMTAVTNSLTELKNLISTLADRQETFLSRVSASNETIAELMSDLCIVLEHKGPAAEQGVVDKWSKPIHSNFLLRLGGFLAHVGAFVILIVGLTLTALALAKEIDFGRFVEFAQYIYGGVAIVGTFILFAVLLLLAQGTQVALTMYKDFRSAHGQIHDKQKEPEKKQPEKPDDKPVQTAELPQQENAK